MLPATISGRFQHHCAGFNREPGPLAPKDIEGKTVGVRTYAQTTGRWIRGILQHEFGVDIDKVTFATVGDGIWRNIAIRPTAAACPWVPISGR